MNFDSPKTIERLRSLSELGWNDSYIEKNPRDGMPQCFPARIVETQRDLSLIAFELSPGAGLKTGEARMPGRFRYLAEGHADFPAVGDWVLAENASQNGAGAPGEGFYLIREILPRKSKLSRKAAGEPDHDEIAEQVIAANLDKVGIVMAMDRDFNVRRLERYLAMVWESGAAPAIILTKLDLAPEPAIMLAEVEALAFGTPLAAVCAPEGCGIGEAKSLFRPGETLAFVGSSGAGKSTLLNALAGEELAKIGDLRSDGKGRHTTTARSLFALPWGALVVDTPGMRELQLWAEGDSLDSAFPDIEALAGSCKFRDCSHEGEPGCAVRRALEEGELSEERWANYSKLNKELAYLVRRTDPAAAKAERERWRKIGIWQKQISKAR